MQRRDFLKSLGAASTATLLGPGHVFGGAGAPRFFALHPFVTAHPDAVFIARTAVVDKTDAAGKLSAGLQLARELFTVSNEAGIPLRSKIAVKPNLTCGGSSAADRMGIVTDSDFVEGFLSGIGELGVRGEQFYLREGNLLGDAYCPNSDAAAWYRPMVERLGAHLTDFDSGKDMAAAALGNLVEGSEVVWRDVPDGVVYQRIGYVAPINADDAWNLNISKFKAHGMGLTLCCKNWQGTNVHPYVHYCSSVPKQFENSEAAVDVQTDYRSQLRALHDRHREGGVPRWDRPGTIDDWNSGAGMEQWAQKTLDNLSASKSGLSIIEGLYGRNGNGFTRGPGSGGKAQDFMTNVVIFGLNPVLVDIVGHWLGGHEPGNFGLFHAALDRGLTDRINPHSIPVYDWHQGSPQWQALNSFERFPLSTYYLRRDWAGQNEDEYHLLDQPYAYQTPTAVAMGHETRPRSFVLGQNYPNPFNAATVIEYRLPAADRVRIDVYDAGGQVVDVLVDAWRQAGSHVVTWDAGHRASGTYFYQLRTPGFRETHKMVMLR